MPVISKSLTDALQQILQSLQVPFIFPAAVFVLVTSLIYPGDINVDNAALAVIIAVITVISSYLLYALNIPIIRLVEGYTLEQTWFFRLTHWFEKKRYKKLKEQVDECDIAIAELKLFEDKLLLSDLLTDGTAERLQYLRTKWINRKRPLQELMELRFPVTFQEPLPTSLGNAIAAFEDYPWTRYSMDAVHLWPRLLPVLEEKKFISFVQSEKTIFDFLLNIGFVILGICFELLLMFAFFEPDAFYLLTVAVLLIIDYILYRAAIVAAVHWGGMVRVAFDLYRDDLRRALHLPDLPDESLVEERTLWKTVSSFIVFGDDEHFKGFVHSKPRNEKENATCTASG
jgi:hypothetical protein